MTTNRTLLIASALLVGSLASACSSDVAFAQSSAARDSIRDAKGDTTRATLVAPVTVSVTRDAARSPFELPFATSRVTPSASRPGLRRTSISELLLGVPGVVVQDRANPSQDPRLTVRGFGARSAFGVRGVRVLRDGIPLSLPDGQTPVDWLDLETVGDIDVVRGTAAALYGNAAGGVVDFRSRAPETAPFAISSRVTRGGNITRSNLTASGRARIDAAATVRDFGWLVSGTGTHGDGARAWSRTDASSAFARTFAHVAGTRVELQATRYDASRAENTGALTAAELARDAALPDSLNITKRSRKSAQQSQVAVIASRVNGANEWTASAFTSARVLDNPLPFAIVAIDRHVAGASLRGTRRMPALHVGAVPLPVRVTAGFDLQRQDDDRLNYENCADVPTATPVSGRCPTRAAERGAIRLNQRELVTGTGAFARAEVELPGAWFVSAAVRRDRVAFHLQDHFITTTSLDDSGDRTLDAVSPLFAVVWRARSTLSFYANVARAFETPTITELTNQADGSAGLNGALAPQRTSTVEVGSQALFASRIRMDIAAFRARVRDELVSFDVPNAPGRRAFRNAGRTSRNGVELSVATTAGAADIGVAYTLSRFRFTNYAVGAVRYDGKMIPGIPEQQGQAFVTVRRAGWFGTVDVTAASRSSANDGSTVFAAGYATWALRGGYDGTVGRGHLTIAPVGGIENVFDRRYASSVVVNATRARYFEPGATRRAYLGVKLGAR